MLFLRFRKFKCHKNDITDYKKKKNRAVSKEKNVAWSNSCCYIVTYLFSTMLRTVLTLLGIVCGVCSVNLDITSPTITVSIFAGFASKGTQQGVCAYGMFLTTFF